MTNCIRKTTLFRWTMLSLVGLVAYRSLGPQARRLSSVPNEGACPNAVLKAKGIYAVKNGADVPLNNVVLAVSVNSGYRQLLQIWEKLAEKHGLQYVIVAMDRQLYQRLRARKRKMSASTFMLAAQRTSKESSGFRSPEFNEISCNKVRVVLDILEKCKSDVVFTDVDNIFLKDPFQGELGRLIRSGKYGYVYQHNDSEGSASCWKGDLAEEGNTGFYFISHTAYAVHDVMRQTLHQCEEKGNVLDDQTLFWNAMRRKFHRETYRHCDENSEDNVFQGTSFLPHESVSATAMCCLDARLYPTGRGNVSEATETFHANYIVGGNEKINRIRQVLRQLENSSTLVL